jgi:hypothetical protein
MQANKEVDVVKRYKRVIDALIPYQQSGKLLEGINKFSSRLPSSVRGIIKEEVLRLTSLTNASADNSDFAAFPVQRFSHFGIDMQLDKVGQRILMEETAKYLDRYTVGVFESVMNSEHYQSRIRKEQQKKIAKAFTVQAQSFQDIDFGEDLAVKPRISVTCPSFEKGKSCTLACLSKQGFSVETNRIPVESSEDGIFTFSFPETKGLCKQGTQFFCVKTNSEFNKSTNRFETTFKMVPPTAKKHILAVAEYVKQSVHMLPLQRDLEVERVLQNLDRDHILSNSPWVPLFLASGKGGVSISFALMSQVNFEFNEGFKTLQGLPGKKRLNSLMPELKKFSETFLIRGKFQTKKGPVTVTASFRELNAANILAPFIKMITQTQDYSILQLRLKDITNEPKDIAYNIHDMNKRDYPELDAITYALFCKDVSKQIGELTVPEDTMSTTFPSVIIDDDKPQPVCVVLEPCLDRRCEPRYTMNKEVILKTGLLSKAVGTLDDLSASGLKLTLAPDQKVKIEKEIRVSVPDLKLKNEKYAVIHHNEATGVLRLKLPKEAKTTEGNLSNMMKANSSYFKTRDIALRQQNTFRFLWEISVRFLPCVALLITQNRHLLSRIRTAYSSFDNSDLYPFKPSNNEVQLHGLLADKNTEKPVSSALKKMLNDAQQDLHVVHAIRQSDKSIIYVEEHEFMYGKVRNQIKEHVNKKTVEATVTQMNAISCRSHQTPLTQKRLAFISSLDVELYEKLKEIQRIYTHIIYVTNMSSLHNCFLAAGISPKKKD